MAHPRMYDDSSPAMRRLREICLALPEAFEKEAWGECTFRVTGGSMFAMTDNHHQPSRIPTAISSTWINSTGTSSKFFDDGPSGRAEPRPTNPCTDGSKAERDH